MGANLMNVTLNVLALTLIQMPVLTIRLRQEESTSNRISRKWIIMQNH